MNGFGKYRCHRREELAAVLQELIAVQIDLLRRAQNGTGARKAESVLTPNRPSPPAVPVSHKIARLPRQAAAGVTSVSRTGILL